MRLDTLALTFLLALTAYSGSTPSYADSTPAEVMLTTEEGDTRATLSLATDVLIYDLVYAGPNSISGHVAGRFLRDIASLPRSTQFTEVKLSYLGDVRFRIAESDMRRLVAGYRVGDMSAFRKMMELPSVVKSASGERIFPVRQGRSLAGINARAEDFNSMLKRWYLSELLASMPHQP